MEEPTDDCLCVGIFSALEPQIRRKFADLGEVLQFATGTALTKQGRPQEFMAVVINGKVSVTCQAHGDIIHLADIEAGGLIGEMSLFDRSPASADVTVTGAPADVWKIHYDAFDRFLEEEPSAAIQVYKIIATELCRLLRCNSENMLHNKDTLRSRFLDMDY